MDIRMSRLEKMISEKNVTTPATVKAVEEVCVTCGSNHNFNNCPLTRNEFPVFHDNIHQFQQTAAVGNFVQRNPPNLANQMRPPGFNVQNNQGNQSRYQGNNFNSNQNRGNNFNQNHQNNQGQVFQPPTNQPPLLTNFHHYQAPTSQIQGVSKTDFKNYVKANDAVLKNVQNQGQNLHNQMANVTSLLTNLCNNFKDFASTSNSGTLPSQTVTNPRQQINAITTRSGKTLEGPLNPFVPTLPPEFQILKKKNMNTTLRRQRKKCKNPNLERYRTSPPPRKRYYIQLKFPKQKAKKTVNNSIGTSAFKQIPELALIFLPHIIYKKLLGLEAFDFPTNSNDTSSLPIVHYSHPMGIVEDALAEENFQDHSNPLFEFDDNFKSSTINPLFDEMEEDVEIKNSNVSDEPVLLNTPLSDKVECFAPEDNNDEIDAFLAMEVSSNFEEGYFDSEGDVTFLDNLLSDDASHNLASEVIFESSITFSPRSDPLHHEFAGELLTLPSGNDREFEEYLSLMTVLCEISTSQSQENVHANQSSVIESLPVSPIPVEDSEPAQEEIDIFLVPDDLIPPGVENDDSEDEVNELPNLDHQDDPSIPRPPPEPPDVEKCFEPEAGILITKVFKGVSKSHDFMTNILPTLPTLVSDLTFILFLSSFLSFGSEDTVFDPGIVTFHKPVAFSMEVSCVALPKDN
ncbi:hypothetical protein Tco_0421275 [Tanacetum coccineum]